MICAYQWHENDDVLLRAYCLDPSTPLSERACPWPPWLKEAAEKRPSERGSLYRNGGEANCARIHTREGRHTVTAGDVVTEAELL